MAFKISQSTTYKWPVTVKFPKDGGTFEQQTFDAVFHRIPQARITEILNPTTKTTDQALAKEMLAGWEGIKGVDEQDYPFSDSTIDALLDIALVASAISEAWLESLQGARRKN